MSIIHHESESFDFSPISIIIIVIFNPKSLSLHCPATYPQISLNEMFHFFRKSNSLFADSSRWLSNEITRLECDLREIFRENWGHKMISQGFRDENVFVEVQQNTFEYFSYEKSNIASENK